MRSAPGSKRSKCQQRSQGLAYRLRLFHWYCYEYEHDAKQKGLKAHEQILALNSRVVGREHMKAAAVPRHSNQQRQGHKTKQCLHTKVILRASTASEAWEFKVGTLWKNRRFPKSGPKKSLLYGYSYFGVYIGVPLFWDLLIFSRSPALHVKPSSGFNRPRGILPPASMIAFLKLSKLRIT